MHGLADRNAPRKTKFTSGAVWVSAASLSKPDFTHVPKQLELDPEKKKLATRSCSNLSPDAQRRRWRQRQRYLSSAPDTALDGSPRTDCWSDHLRRTSDTSR